MFEYTNKKGHGTVKKVYKKQSVRYKTVKVKNLLQSNKWRNKVTREKTSEQTAGVRKEDLGTKSVCQSTEGDAHKPKLMVYLVGIGHILAML